MSTAPVEPCKLVEEAFASYWSQTFGDDTDFAGCSFPISQSDQERSLPVVASICENLRSLIRTGSGRYRGIVTFSLYTALDADREAQDAHDKRVLKIGNYLEFLADIKAALNKPDTGEDTRTVKPFCLLDILSISQRRESTEEVFGHHFDVDVVISVYDY